MVTQRDRTAGEDLVNLPVNECVERGDVVIRESMSAMFLALLLRLCKVRRAVRDQKKKPRNRGHQPFLYQEAIVVGMEICLSL